MCTDLLKDDPDSSIIKALHEWESIMYISIFSLTLTLTNKQTNKHNAEKDSHNTTVYTSLSNNKERNVDSMFFPLKCNSPLPPSRAAVPITIELFCLCGQLLDVSTRASSAQSILHAYKLEFFNLYTLKTIPNH